MDTLEGVLALAAVIGTVVGVPAYVVWSMASDSPRPTRTAVQATTWLLWLIVAIAAFSAMLAGLKGWGVSLSALGWITGGLLALAAITWYSRENG